MLRFGLLAAAIGSVSAVGFRDALASQPDLSGFKNLLDQYDVWKPLNDMKNITILAPDNAAYELLASIGLNLTEMGANFTVPVLKYHFLQGLFDTGSFVDDLHATLAHTALTGLNTSQSAPVKISRHGDERFVEGGLGLSAGVQGKDIPFDGGVIHVLNSTLVAPHNISATAFMSGLYEFLGVMADSEMVTALENLHDSTVFVPSDEAWQRYKSSGVNMTDTVQLAKSLSYHAIPNRVLYQETLGEAEQTFTTLEGHSIKVKTDDQGKIFVNDVPVIKEDVIWYGGVVHVVNEVLVPKTGTFEVLV